MTVAKKFIIYIFFFTFYSSFAVAEFFKDISDIIENNEPRLSYGVAVSDVNNDNKFEFVVTGFGYKNLALGFENNNLVNTIDNEIFNDAERKTIGVAACDIDKDGFEEVWRSPENFSARGVAAADYDGDGFVDVYVSNYRLQPNFLWKNATCSAICWAFVMCVSMM